MFVEQTNIQTKQDKAHVRIICSGLEESVVVRAELYERVSDLFNIQVIIRTKQQIDTSKLITKNACLVLHSPEKSEKYFSGLISSASIENVPSSDTNDVRANNILCLTIVPTIFKLSLTKKYRIFQELSVTEIIEKILKENGISNIKKNVTSNGQTKRIFCVQYGESDLHFISRLMEEEGIFYFFIHEKNKDIFCFSDNSSGGKKIFPKLVVQKHFHKQYTDINAVYNISMKENVCIKSIQAISFNEDKFTTISGTANDSNPIYKIGKLELYSSPFDNANLGNSISKNALECENSMSKFLNCQSTCVNVYTGGICSIQESAITEQNGDFFIIEIKHLINQITNDTNLPFYENKMFLIPSSIPFRPKQKHFKNKIYGTQTATVTGASGEEIFCDEKGRVKVKFHWDTRAEENEKSSCWIRVIQSWAGKNFGGLITPRVGMEVLVNFIDGDPDQPIIVGCVYNGVNTPPSNYPKEKKTASTFYTDSSKGSEGFNELRFDDAKDEEEIFIHAQKDLNKVIENSVTETLNKGSKTVTLESQDDKVEHIILIKNGDYKTTIKEGNMSIILNKGNQEFLLTEGDQIISLTKGNQSITLTEGNQTITLNKGNVKVDVKGDISITAENINIDASKNININAKGAINVSTKDSATFKTAQDFVINSSMKANITAKMDVNIESKMNITEKGLNINRTANIGITDKANAKFAIESTATLTIKGNAMADINGGGMLKLAGGIVKLN